ISYILDPKPTMNHYRLLITKSCSLSKNVTPKLNSMKHKTFVCEARRHFKPSFTISQLQNIRSLTSEASTPNLTESDASTASQLKNVSFCVWQLFTSYPTFIFQFAKYRFLFP